MKHFTPGSYKDSVSPTLSRRNSEDTNAAERIQAASSPPTSPPPVQPRTPLIDRKIRSSERRKYGSDTYFPLASPPLRGPARPSLEPSYFPPVLVHEESSSIWTKKSNRSESSDGLSPSQLPSVRHSPKFSKAPPSATSDNYEKGSPEARSSRKWKHETSGLWLEVHVGKEHSSTTSEEEGDNKGPIMRRSSLTEYKTRNDEVQIVPSSPMTPRSLTDTFNISRSPTKPATKGNAEEPFEDPKEGLYCRTKRALGLKHGPVLGSRDEQQISAQAMTEETNGALDKVSSALRLFALKGREPTSSSDSASNMSIAAPSAISRWHHLQSVHSGSTSSSSSSLRSFKRGPSRPVTTPDPQNMYVGSDLNRYLPVDLTASDSPTFLPSEARRVDTPGKKQFTSFLESNLSSAVDTPSLYSSKSTDSDLARFERSVDDRLPFILKPEKDLQHLLGLPRRVSNTGYVRTQLNDISADEARICAQRVLDVPEHLPSSPMCPRHPKNKSKGEGVCPYHG